MRTPLVSINITHDELLHGHLVLLGLVMRLMSLHFVFVCHLPISFCPCISQRIPKPCAVYCQDSLLNLLILNPKIYNVAQVLWGCESYPEQKPQEWFRYLNIKTQITSQDMHMTV